MQNRQVQIQDKQLMISCVVPVYNEEKNISKFVSALRETLIKITNKFEIVIVNDGSTDSTQSCLLNYQHDPAIKWLTFSRNFGKEAALSAGLEHVSGDVTILIDADFQHPLELIPTFVEKWGQGYDVVYGTQENRSAQSFVLKSASRFFYKVLGRISKISIPENAGDFRLLDQKAVEQLNRLEERERFMKGLYAWVGFSQHAVPFVAPKREQGQSGWGLRKLIELALVGITSFSNTPLRFASYLGLFISLVSFVYGGLIIVDTLIFGDEVRGYTTLMVSIMFLGGVQLLSIGILGEYIARIFTEVKRRPTYIVESKKGFE